MTWHPSPRIGGYRGIRRAVSSRLWAVKKKRCCLHQKCHKIHIIKKNMAQDPASSRIHELNTIHWVEVQHKHIVISSHHGICQYIQLELAAHIFYSIITYCIIYHISFHWKATCILLLGSFGILSVFLGKVTNLLVNRVKSIPFHDPLNGIKLTNKIDQ